MRKSRFTREQIVGMLREADAVAEVQEILLELYRPMSTPGGPIPRWPRRRLLVRLPGLHQGTHPASRPTDVASRRSAVRPLPRDPIVLRQCGSLARTAVDPRSLPLAPPPAPRPAPPPKLLAGQACSGRNGNRVHQRLGAATSVPAQAPGLVPRKSSTSRHYCHQRGAHALGGLRHRHGCHGSSGWLGDGHA